MSSKRKLVAAGLCGVVLIAAAFMWLNSSNEGKITPVNTESPSAFSPTGHKDFEGKYIKFTHLSTYLTQTLKATGNDLELYKLSAGTAYEKTLAVSVSTLPQGRLDQNSAYVLRKTRSDIYKESQVPFRGGTASVWTRNNGQEITAFMQQGSRIAMLSFVQGQTVDNDLGSEVEAAVRSFAWK